MNTVQNACLMSFGTISKQEYANRCTQDLVVTACSVGLGTVSGTVVSALLTPAFAVFGYMVGSFVGSVLGSFVHKGVYSCVVALSAESGSTFFGLVEQNYELPPDVLESIGAKVFEYEKFKLAAFSAQKFGAKRFEHQKFEPVKINVTFLRRGVVSVSAIGYI
jgi:hypothetical protein